MYNRLVIGSLDIILGIILLKLVSKNKKHLSKTVVLLNDIVGAFGILWGVLYIFMTMLSTGVK